jgi:hypothetical protein
VTGIVDENDLTGSALIEAIMLYGDTDQATAEKMAADGTAISLLRSAIRADKLRHMDLFAPWGHA